MNLCLCIYLYIYLLYFFDLSCFVCFVFQLHCNLLLWSRVINLFLIIFFFNTIF
ncbi:hypothetical protein H8356DRAFT_1660978 [Neocallimastix lanati (nom. inval.)]|nr:hypothetical protein H8356DRAFT_1660978 [Neocallimastix sp. JGI-2020a]